MKKNEKIFSASLANRNMIQRRNQDVDDKPIWQH